MDEWRKRESEREKTEERRRRRRRKCRKRRRGRGRKGGRGNGGGGGGRRRRKGEKNQGNQVDILVFLPFGGNEKVGKDLNLSVKKEKQNKPKRRSRRMAEAKEEFGKLCFI